MIRNILTNIFLTIFSISILFIIYGCFVIPYKIITNTARSDSSQIYASFNDKLGYVPNNNLNGSLRAIIPFGRWENMLPMRIYPDFLVKSILAKDIDMMENLGIYECVPEDFALCSYVCQSKIEVSSIIQNGLECIEVEG